LYAAKLLSHTAYDEIHRTLWTAIYNEEFRWQD
jgi:hypothetical protein